MKSISFLALSAFLLALPLAASAQSETTETEKEKPKKEEVKPIARQGVLMGHLTLIHPEKTSIVVRREDTRVRLTFLLDRRTKYRLKRRRKRVDILDVGQKVAVRYFGENHFLIAEEVYVVEGEFQPADYTGKKKKKKRK